MVFHLILNFNITRGGSKVNANKLKKIASEQVNVSMELRYGSKGEVCMRIKFKFKF